MPLPRLAEEPTETVLPERRKHEKRKPKKQPRYNVVLWNDDDHTYAYVITMLLELFAYPVEKGYQMAQEVDTQGRVIVLTTTMEHAELKRDQIHAYGKDVLIADCQGSMSASIEPVEADRQPASRHFRLKAGLTLAMPRDRFATLRPNYSLAARRCMEALLNRGTVHVCMELAMIGKWAFRIAALGLVLGIQATAISRADTPWSNLLATNRVEADPAKPYTLKEEHGPWIIMACSFNGENAQKQAHDLVLELRKRYRMEAFVYHMDFKLDDPNGNVQPLFASPHRHQYHMVTENPKAYRDGEIKEIAVVVGNFPAIDDPDAQRALQKLKAADPECLHSNQARRRRDESRSLAAWRSLQAGVRACPSTSKAASKPVRSRTPSLPAIRCCPRITSLPREAWTNWS